MSEQNQQAIASDIQHFIDALKTVGGGEIAEEAAVKLKECVRGTMIEGKKSKLTISLEIAHTTEETVSIAGEVKATIPKPKIKSSYFVNLQTMLPTRNRPEQQPLKGLE